MAHGSGMRHRILAFLWRAPEKYNLVARILWRIPLFPGCATEFQKGAPLIGLSLVVDVEFEILIFCIRIDALFVSAIISHVRIVISLSYSYFRLFTHDAMRTRSNMSGEQLGWASC